MTHINTDPVPVAGLIESVLAAVQAVGSPANGSGPSLGSSGPAGPDARTWQQRAWEATEGSGKAVRALTMRVCGYLNKQGVRDPGTLEGVARLVVSRAATIRTPYAYFNRGADGCERLLRDLSARATVAEHRRLEPKRR